jgi:hypothetical protein
MSTATRPDRVAPTVSEVFRFYTSSIGRAYYYEDESNGSHPEDDDEPILPIDSRPMVLGQDESIEPTPKCQDELCLTCSQLDLDSIFCYGIPQTQTERTSGQGQQPGIALGSLEEISQRQRCPFCRLICKLSDEKYCDILKAGSAFSDITPLITCWLQCIRADELPDLYPPGSGPAAFYINIKCNLEDDEILPTRERYLVLDSASSNLVDPSWVDLRKPVTITVPGGQEGYKSEPEKPKKPDGLLRKYFYNARRVRENQVDFELVKGWLLHCENTHGQRDCIAKSARGLPSRFRVIDVVKRALVVAPPRCRYIAISYVWGKRESGEQPIYSLTSGRLPRTLEDAITVVKELGERYLWVDACW